MYSIVQCTYSQRRQTKRKWTNPICLTFFGIFRIQKLQAYHYRWLLPQLSVNSIRVGCIGIPLAKIWFESFTFCFRVAHIHSDIDFDSAFAIHIHRAAKMNFKVMWECWTRRSVTHPNWVARCAQSVNDVSCVSTKLKKQTNSRRIRTRAFESDAKFLMNFPSLFRGIKLMACFYRRT